jgi:ankyrin repeat protein
MEQGYLAQVQALIDQKWKENPEEMKRVMAEIKAKEKQKAKVKPPRQVSFDPQLTQELIEELNKDWDVVDMSKVQDLIKRGADVNAKSNWGTTPLHVTSRDNHIEIVKLLLDAGADVEAKDNFGRTPLHWASGNNHIEIAKLLIERGADVGAKANNGSTPLHVAHSDGMKTLLKKYMK